MAPSDDSVYLKLLTRHEHLGIVRNPEILKFYKGIDDTLPVLIVQAIDGQLRRAYKYALGGQIVAGIAGTLMAGGFVFLVMFGHERPAYVLPGAGVLNTIGGFLRARLSDSKQRNQESKARSEAGE